MVTTEQVKELRDETGISVMQCRKALDEAGGDKAKALAILRKHGAEVAAKKGGRALRAGAVASYVHAGGRVGAMVLLSSETDFVSGNEGFQKLAYDIAMHVAAANPEYVRQEDVPPEKMRELEALYASGAMGKPVDMQKKVIEGTMDAYLAERVLLEQAFIKDPGRTIQSLLEEAAHKFGERIEVTRFERFAVGE